MMEQKQQMHAQRLGQSLAVALSLVLLIVGVIGQSDAVPPDLDVSLSGFRIVAYTTDRIECQPDLLCPGAPRDYQVVWAFSETAPDYVPEIWHRILTVPLQR